MRPLHIQTPTGGFPEMRVRDFADRYTFESLREVTNNFTDSSKLRFVSFKKGRRTHLIELANFRAASEDSRSDIVVLCLVSTLNGFFTPSTVSFVLKDINRRFSEIEGNGYLSGGLSEESLLDYNRMEQDIARLWEGSGNE